jgi:hypothetical protein
MYLSGYHPDDEYDGVNIHTKAGGLYIRGAEYIYGKTRFIYTL